jgi:Integrase core domain
MAGRISMGARREVVSAVAERYRSAKRAEKGRILDELCKVTGWHRKHAVRALGGKSTIVLDRPRQRKPTYGSIIKDAVVALWEASDRVCGKRLKVMIPTLLPALERHGRLELSQADRVLVLEVSAATIDRQLVDTKIAAAGGKRRRVGFYSAIRREVPIRTFNDWNDPAPGFCEVDMVAHGGTSVAGAFIQTLTMVDVATGWTECMPLVTRESGLVVQAMERAQSLFPWLVLGADFDNDSAFMNDVVVPWCREQKIEVTRSRAYKKNDQAFVEQKNGAVVRRLVGYGRFEGIDTARVLVRLYAASRLHTNFFQPSFKLKDKRREGAKVIKRYHAPATPYARALAHPKLSEAVKQRLRELHRTLDPVVLLAEIRDAQTELGTRVDCKAGKIAAAPCALPSAPDAAAFAKGLGKAVLAGEQRAIHRRLHKPYKKRVRMPSMLDPHVEEIERWLAAEPRLTALVILDRLAARCPGQFGPPQHTIVQRLLKALRKNAAENLIAQKPPSATKTAAPFTGPVDGSGYGGPDPPTGPAVERASQAARLNRSAQVGSSAPTAPSG